MNEPYPTPTFLYVSVFQQQGGTQIEKLLYVIKIDLELKQCNVIYCHFLFQESSDENWLWWLHLRLLTFVD